MNLRQVDWTKLGVWLGLFVLFLLPSGLLANTPTTLVITRMCDGCLGSDSEFVEVFNPTSDTLTLTRLNEEANGDRWTGAMDLGPGDSVSFYDGEPTVGTGDVAVTLSPGNDEGFLIEQNNGDTDALGWGICGTNCEGVAFGGGADNIRRKWTDNFVPVDTDDNSQDFTNMATEMGYNSNGDASTLVITRMCDNCDSNSAEFVEVFNPTSTTLTLIRLHEEANGDRWNGSLNIAPGDSFSFYDSADSPPAVGTGDTTVTLSPGADEGFLIEQANGDTDALAWGICGADCEGSAFQGGSNNIRRKWDQTNVPIDTNDNSQDLTNMATEMGYHEQGALATGRTIFIDNLSDGEDTSVTPIPVNGSTSNANQGDSVEVKLDNVVQDSTTVQSDSTWSVPSISLDSKGHQLEAVLYEGSTSDTVADTVAITVNYRACGPGFSDTFVDPNGTTKDSFGCWSTEMGSGGSEQWSVQNQQIQGANLDAPSTWVTKQLDVADSGTLEVEFFLRSPDASGNYEGSDYVRAIADTEGGSVELWRKDGFISGTYISEVSTISASDSLTLKIVGENNQSNERYQFDTVAVRTAPPSITIESPPDGHDTSVSSIGVSGSAISADQNDAVVIDVNGTQADTTSLNADLSWSVSGIGINDGGNTVVAKLKGTSDPSGTTIASDTITVTRFQKASLVINEVVPEPNDVAADSEWVELQVTDTGVMPEGAYLEDGGAGNVDLSVIKGSLNKGDYIVVLQDDGTSDTDSKTSGSGAHHSDTFWNVYDPNLGSLTLSENYVFLRDGTDQILDAVIWGAPTGTLNQQTQLQEAFDDGEWDQEVKGWGAFDQVSSNANAPDTNAPPRVFYRDQALSDSHSRFGWDELPEGGATMGSANNDSRHNQGVGGGTTTQRPEAVVTPGASGVEFTMIYHANRDFGDDGRDGYVTHTITKESGYPSPTLTDGTDSGFITINAPNATIDDSGIYSTPGGDSVVWAVLRASAIDQDAFLQGDTVSFVLGDQSRGGPGLVIPSGNTGDKDTFSVRVDPRGNNFKLLPEAQQPAIRKSDPDHLEFSPQPIEVNPGEVATFDVIVNDVVDNRVLGADLNWEILRTPAGASQHQMNDTSPTDGVTDEGGDVQYKFQTDTDVVGFYDLQFSVEGYDVSDTVRVQASVNPLELGGSRLIGDTVLVAGAADEAVNDRYVLFYNSQRSEYNIKNKYLARYDGASNWHNPVGGSHRLDESLAAVTMNQATDWTIPPGGWFLIARDRTADGDMPNDLNNTADVLLDDALVLNGDRAIGLFHNDPDGAGSASAAADMRFDAMGFEGALVFEGDTVDNAPGSDSRALRLPNVTEVDSPVAAYFDRDNNDSDIESGVLRTDLLRNSSSDTVLPAFHITGPDTVDRGGTFTLDAQMTIETANGVDTSITVTDYTGDSAWADVFVDRGSISPEQTGTFSNGQRSEVFSLTNESGQVVISFVDGSGLGQHTIEVINEPPIVETVYPDTGVYLKGDISGTYVISDSSTADTTGSVEVQYSTDTGQSWNNATMVDPSQIDDVPMSVTGETNSFVWDSASDISDTISQNVQLRIRGNDGFDRGEWDTTPVFTVDNVPAPTIDFVYPDTGAYESGDVPGTYVLTGGDARSGTVSIEYSTDGGATWTDTPLTIIGDTASLSMSLTGDTHGFDWDTIQDLGDTVQNSSVLLRARAYDGFDTGAWDTTPLFTVDNRDPPIVDSLSALAVVNQADTGVELTWSGDTDTQKFIIYRHSRIDTTAVTQIDTRPAGSDSYVYLDTGAVRGDTQYYWVTRMDTASNESKFSTEQTAPYFEISKTNDSDTPFLPGDTIVYTISYGNSGFGPTAGDLVIEDYKPEHSIISDTATVVSGPSATISYKVSGTYQSSFTENAELVRWTISQPIYPKSPGTVEGELRFEVRIE